MAWNSDGTWTAEDDSVSKQVTGLMSQDSALMRQARTAGTTSAARRGLLNSSIAAGAAENAALSYVTPIASQQSSQIATANNNAASIKADADRTATTLASQEKLNSENITSQEKISAAGLQSDWDRQQASIASQEKISAADREAETAKAQATLAAQERTAIMDAIAKAQDNYTTGITNTLQNEKISATTRNSAQADIAAQYSKSISALQSLYPDVTLNWGT
jgi:hypothetical protein